MCRVEATTSNLPYPEQWRQEAIRRDLLLQVGWDKMLLGAHLQAEALLKPAVHEDDFIAQGKYVADSNDDGGSADTIKAVLTEGGSTDWHVQKREKYSEYSSWQLARWLLGRDASFGSVLLVMKHPNCSCVTLQDDATI